MRCAQLSIALLVLLSTSCVTGLRMNNSYASKNYGSRVEYIVLHFTAGDFQSSLHQLTEGEVSSHYLVSESPEIFRLVNEDLRAYHAGKSYWKGENGLNWNSIGIEIVNPGCNTVSENMHCADYPEAQIDLVIELLQSLVAKHNIGRDHIIGHGDIAPDRKIDPGPKFPWKRLAQAGLISWPDENVVLEKKQRFESQVPEAAWFQHKLARLGYDPPMSAQFDASTTKIVSAFQMKYRPSKCDGLPDAETAALIDTLASGLRIAF